MGGKRLDFERVDVSEPASISSGIAARYATAVFELSKDAKGLKALETDIDAMGAALEGSDDLRTLISSPLYSRAEQGGAIGVLLVQYTIQVYMGTNINLTELYFEYEVLTRIIGEPDFEMLHVLFRELKANAAAVPCSSVVDPTITLEYLSAQRSMLQFLQ